MGRDCNNNYNRNMESPSVCWKGLLLLFSSQALVGRSVFLACLGWSGKRAHSNLSDIPAERGEWRKEKELSKESQQLSIGDKSMATGQRPSLGCSLRDKPGIRRPKALPLPARPKQGP